MSENKFETVSSLLDNYQQETLDNDQLAEVVADDELSDTWQRYSLIGDVLRDETPQAIKLDLAADIAKAIEQEPTVLAPTPKISLFLSAKAKVVQFAKPIGQMAIAASAAGLMIIGVQQNTAENDLPSPNRVVQTVPFGGVADPVSFNYQSPNRVSQKQAYIEQKRRFQALLADHQQQVKLSSVTGIAAKSEKITEQKDIDTPQ